MKLNKTDIYNLGCLQLAREGAYSDDECLQAMNWGNKTRARTQSRYLKKLVNVLANINTQHNISEQFNDQVDNLEEKYHEQAVKPTRESGDHKEEEQGTEGTSGIKWD